MTFTPKFLSGGLPVCPMCLQRLDPPRTFEMKCFVADCRSTVKTHGPIRFSREVLCLLMPQADQAAKQSRHAVMSWLGGQPAFVKGMRMNPLPTRQRLEGDDLWVTLQRDVIEQPDLLGAPFTLLIRTLAALLAPWSIDWGRHLAQSRLVQAVQRCPSHQAKERPRLALAYQASTHQGDHHAHR